MKNSLIWPRYFIIFPEQVSKDIDGRLDGIDRIDVLGALETKDKTEQDDEDFKGQDAKNNLISKGFNTEQDGP